MLHKSSVLLFIILGALNGCALTSHQNDSRSMVPRRSLDAYATALMQQLTSTPNVMVDESGNAPAKIKTKLNSGELEVDEGTAKTHLMASEARDPWLTNTDQTPLQMAKPGPYQVRVLEDRSSRLPSMKVLYDAFIPQDLAEPTPVILFLHGSYSDKRAHWQQAYHLASWGFHSVCAEVPNKKRWREAGQNLATFLDKIHQRALIPSSQIREGHIYLVGHSFGGSAALVAEQERTQSPPKSLQGLVLLDPALVHKDIRSLLPKVRTPTTLLLADPDVYRPKGRELFFRHIPSRLIEVTIRGADHDDAQEPTMIEHWIGFDPFKSADAQASFRELLTVSLLSLNRYQDHRLTRAYAQKLREQGVVKEIRSHGRR